MRYMELESKKKEIEVRYCCIWILSFWKQKLFGAAAVLMCHWMHFYNYLTVKSGVTEWKIKSLRAARVTGEEALSDEIK